MVQRLWDGLRGLSPARLATLGLVVFGLIGALGFVITKSIKPEMGVLFSNLDATDSGKMITKLQEHNVPYDISPDSTQILVPRGEIARLRMEMAQEGLPAGGSVGFEIFDKNDLAGLNNSLLDINYLRALEGELTRSISTIQGIMSSRIHLVMPKRELFSRQTQIPSASVIVRLKPSCVLSATQIQSIQYLVACGVSGLTQDRVAIVDDKGALLARGGDKESASAGHFNLQQDLRLQLENRVARSIESLLDRTLGMGKSRAEVCADLDFDQQNSTAVEYNPDGQVTRSTSSSEEKDDTQEQADEQSVGVENALPGGGGKNTNGKSNKNSTNNTKELINYEISNTTKNFVKEVGVIKRLSIAVIIDGKMVKNEDGSSTYAPRSDDEIEKLTTLVKTAIGFQEDRADQVQVLNMPFAVTEEDIGTTNSTNTWSQVSLQKIIELLIIGGLILACLFFVVRPMVSQLLKTQPGGGGMRELLHGSTNAMVAGPDGLYTSDNTVIGSSLAGVGGSNLPVTASPSAMAGAIFSSKKEEGEDEVDFLLQQSPIRKIGKIVERYPEESTAVIRSWIYNS